MKAKIVKVQIIDYDANGEILLEYDFVNPDKNKLAKLKHMVEHRFEYQFDENSSDEEIEKAEKFCDTIWDNINNFINENFITLNIEEVYEIEY